MNHLPVRRSRFVIPFRFGNEDRSNRDYIRFLDRKTDRFHGSWAEDTVLEGEQDLYGYVLHSFDDRGHSLPGNIGAAFRYHVEQEEGGKAPYLIPLVYYAGEKGGNKTCEFDITDAGITLFVTGVGFFWYDISELRVGGGETFSIDDDIRFTSRFKELNYERNIKIFRRRDADSPFTVGDWAAEVVMNACPGATFFAERKNVLTKNDEAPAVPDKALLFQYAAYDKSQIDRETVKEASYYLTKGYSRSYRIPDDYDKLIKKPFNNVIWFASKEGVGYFVLEEEENAQFFIHDMPRGFMRDYFLLYTLALHEQYTVLRFAERMAEELPADPQAYLTSDLYLDVLGEADSSRSELLDLERKVTRLSTEINVFFAKSVRSSVSFVDHQDRFYRYIIRNMTVRQDTDMIMQGLNALQMLLKDVVRQEEAVDSARLQTWREERAYQKLEREKEILIDELYHDATTGLYNKNGLLHYGRKLYSDAREQGKALFVCVADMNGLKYINDNFGHDDGDKALRGTAKILTDSVCEGDYVFRQGGDEFLVMGIREPGSNEEQEFSARAEAAMVKYNEEYHDDRYRVAMSYGPLLSDMRTCTDTLDRLMEISDELMYKMKMSRDEHRRE